MGAASLGEAQVRSTCSDTQDTADSAVTSEPLVARWQAPKKINHKKNPHEAGFSLLY